MSTLVMKFGGASVASPDQFARVADMIIEKKREYRSIAVVVSAMADTTDQLIALSQRVNPNPPQREYDMLVTVGERISIALLAMALAAKNQDAVSYTGSQSGIITCTNHAEARIVDVRPNRLLPNLKQGKIVIVAGFQGVSTVGEITTLGRGGSDTTAAALGVALNADIVEFIKDVPGIFDSDPKQNTETKMHARLTYDEALFIALRGAKKVLHPRSIELAKRNRLPLRVRSFQNVEKSLAAGTLICDSEVKPRSSPVYEWIPCSSTEEQPK